MFIIYKCVGEKYYKGESREGIICPVDNQFCPYSGYCTEWRKVRHTEKAKSCKRIEKQAQQENGN